MADSGSQAATASIGNLKQFAIRACGTCVKAKVKCVPNLQNRLKCQRCERLEKQCEPANASSRKRASSSQVAHLEKKLDSLVTLLTATQRSKGSDQPILNFPLPASGLPIKFPEIGCQDAAVTDRNGNQTIIAQYNTPNSSDVQSSEAFVTAFQSRTLGFDLDFHHAAFLLIEFRTQMARQFPFVVIPSDASSDSLRRERPLLWDAIVVAASFHNTSRQEALGTKLMEDFSTRILLRAEKSLDLLQAMLIHLAWYHYHSIINPQTMNLLSLIKSMVLNLGYHRTQTVKDRRKLLIDGPDEAFASSEFEISSPNSKILEERRAFAGCYFLSAMITSSCGEVEPFQYSSHLEASCRILDQSREYESDEKIIHLVSIQHIIIKINGVLNETDERSGLRITPMKMYTKALQSELKSLKQNLPEHLAQNYFILGNYQTAEIALYENGLYRVLNADNNSEHRLTTLYSCLLAVRAFFDTHFSPQSPWPVSHSYFNWIQASYALLIGLKLCSCVVIGWDISHAREVIKFDSAISVVISKLEAIVEMRHASGATPTLPNATLSERDVFARYLRQMRCVKEWYLSMACSITDIHARYAPDRSQKEPTSYDDGAITAPNIKFARLDSEDYFMDMNTDLYEVFHHENNDWMVFDVAL